SILLRCSTTEQPFGCSVVFYIPICLFLIRYPCILRRRPTAIRWSAHLSTELPLNNSWHSLHFRCSRKIGKAGNKFAVRLYHCLPHGSRTNPELSFPIKRAIEDHE